MYPKGKLIFPEFHLEFNKEKATAAGSSWLVVPAVRTWTATETPPPDPSPSLIPQ